MAANPTVDQIPDADILDLVARWQVARLRAMLHWAEGDQKTMFGWRDVDQGSPAEDLKAMKKYADAIAGCEPNTIEGARVMLLVVREILAHRLLHPDPGATMSCGPLLEIVTAVHQALEHGPGETALRNVGLVVGK